MGMSDVIASFIDGLLEEDSTAELQRSELANKFGCVPSQINYVISTRFSPERGYVVESRRGGGGYIRIRRVQTDPKLLVMHTINAIGNSIDLHSAAALLANCVSSGVLDEASAKLMITAIGDNALRPVEPAGRNVLRASILKQMLLSKA
jgi:transcriptional regulator CtsR